MIKKDHFSLNIPGTDKKRVIIIGSGFGGINAAQKLDHKKFQVVLFDQFNHHTFQPLLYQVATASLEPDSIARPVRKIFGGHKSFYFRMQKVTAIDTDRKIVITEVGQVYFDYLIIATGSKTNYYGNTEIEKHAFPLKNVPNALALRNQIFKQLELAEMARNEKDKDQLTNFVIVGGGPTGVELAGAIAELKNHVLPGDYDMDFSGMKIYLIEGMDVLLPAMSKISGKRALKYLKKYGVDVRLGVLTKNYDGTTLKLANDEEIKAKTVIWAAGMKGNLINGLPANTIKKSKYLVNEFNQVRLNEDDENQFDQIFAIGDVALMKSKDRPAGYPGLAQVAIQQGTNLARNLNRSHTADKWEKFRYKDKGALATIGRNKAVADFSDNLKIGGFIGWIIWGIVHLFFLIGFRNKIVVFSNWVLNYFRYDKGMRLIIEQNSEESKKTMVEEPILETQEHY